MEPNFVTASASALPTSNDIITTTTSAVLPAVTFLIAANGGSLLPAVPYAKPFPDISKIEIFSGQNFKRWQERIFFF